MNDQSIIQKSAEGLGIWEHFTVRDGLPDMKIECIFEDSRGVLWIGTHDRGVVRYAGDEFKAYNRRDGLSGDGVFSIIEDRSGVLWFGTNQGLTRYDGQIFEQLDLEMSCSFLWGSCIDHNGVIWFGLERRPGYPPMVCRWDGREVKLVEIAATGTQHGQSIHQIAVDEKGVLWLGGDGLYRCVDGVYFEKIKEPQEPLWQIADLLPRASGRLWIATEGGLWEYRGEGFKKLLEEKGTYGPIALSEDLSGICWLITYDGRLFRYDGSSFVFVFKLNAILRGGLYVDKAGRLWIGTYGMGLYYYDATRLKILHHNQHSSKIVVNCLAESANGDLWAGTEQGLVYYSGEKLLSPKGLEKVNKKEVVTGLLVDKFNHLWIGTRNGYLYHYKNERIEELPIVSTIGGYRISSLLEDLNGRIWFGCRYGKGMGYYENGNMTYFPPEEENKYPTWIGAMEVDTDGNIWIGSSAPAMWDGLCRYNGVSFERIEGISGSSILSLYRDRQGIMWIGTNEGLIRHDGTSVTSFTQKDGLPCELVTTILQAMDGTLWIGTEGGGICCYDGEVFQIIQIPGEPSCNVIHAIHQDCRGRLWFATEGGLIQYVPRRVKPSVHITKVVADRVYTALPDVQFPTTTSWISFCFGGTSPLEHASYLVYRYKLHGCDSIWHQTRERQVEYPQLKPGEYVFSVQAVDRDLNYSDPVEVRLVVTEDPHIEALNEALRAETMKGEFIGESKALKEIKKQIQEVAMTDLTVLILGETGTGKGLAARAVHSFSERRDDPFIHVNCGALQQGLVDSELFGHEKGSFTGAISRKMGKFELASGGTIFLDEIGDLPLEAQTRLLRVLQEKCIERVGGTQTISIDVRVLAATNRDLARAVRDEAFRADVYYRLNVFPIRLPPLRERKEDIPMLSQAFIRRFAAHLNQKIPPFISEDSMKLLLAYGWPGNVRELEHTLQRAVILANLAKESRIMPEHLAIGTVVLGTSHMPDLLDENFTILPLEEYERRYLTWVLEHTDGVIHGQRGAAFLLNMKPTTLRSRLEKLGIKKRRTARH